MVPQGLVLLTSIAFGVAAVILTRPRVLVQQLPAVEGLARVDVVCFDKTGTLTDGTIAFDRLVRLDDRAPVEAALGALGADENRNATLKGIGQAFPAPSGWALDVRVAFSSARKWSGVSCWARRVGGRRPGDHAWRGGRGAAGGGRRASGGGTAGSGGGPGGGALDGERLRAACGRLRRS